MDTTNISRGSLQEKKPKHHSLPIPLKLLSHGQGRRWSGGKGEFCLILPFFLSGLAASAFINKITDLSFY